MQLKHALGLEIDGYELEPHLLGQVARLVIGELEQRKLLEVEHRGEENPLCDWPTLTFPARCVFEELVVIDCLKQGLMEIMSHLLAGWIEGQADLIDEWNRATVQGLSVADQVFREGLGLVRRCHRLQD